MKATPLLTSIVAIGIVSPALAASFYIVQNTKTHKCMVVLQKPSEMSKTFVLVGAGTAYKTKSEATTAMGTINECKST